MKQKKPSVHVSNKNESRRDSQQMHTTKDYYSNTMANV